jgi:hypothetical protein
MIVRKSSVQSTSTSRQRILTRHNSAQTWALIRVRTRAIANDDRELTARDFFRGSRSASINCGPRGRC